MFEQEVKKIIAKAAGLKEIEIALETPPHLDMGDYAFPCFVLAKTMKKNPVAIAEELQKKIKPDAYIEKVKNNGPYLNFFINKKAFNESIIKKILSEKENCGKGKASKEKVMIEYSQPNTHKEFHVGHLRTLFLGESLSRIYEFSGVKVIRANYIGDVGTHIAICLWCYLKFHAKDKIPENKGKYLGKLYVEGVKKVEDNPAYKKEVSEIHQKLENDDKQLIALWKKTKEWSMSEFLAIYKEFDVHFDKIYFESEVEKEGKSIAEILLKKGIAKIDQGAILVDLQKYDLGVFLIKKSDGTSLYATKDLALASRKFKEFAIDESIYVVDSRQKMYFQQLFKVLALMGFTKKLLHLPYEFVALKEGPISSRKGIMALYEEVRDAMIKKSYEETKKRHADWNEKKIMQNAKQITLSALRFSILKIDHNKVITFDIDEALDFEGETGPYIQYAHARICSILKNYGKKTDAKADFSLLHEPEEKELLLLLQQFPFMVADAKEHYKPALMARYLLDLSQKFNEYYHKHQILKEKESVKKARLLLVSAVKIVLANGLLLLGIDALDEM
ncbi:arginine--tRNA ligase [Candidatus Woesearchaeota archaeon]|nr:MAG: arginine--tRNA ligase [Candidatus Woesearchaeota archaeon]